jgi:excisionase family DNA binding protein
LNDDAPDALSEKVYTIAEVAEKLRVSRQVVSRMIERGELPGVVRVGFQYRIPASAIRALAA